MKYRNARTSREMEVGENERVRRQILERIGWQLVEESPESEPVSSVTTTIQGVEVEIRETDNLSQLKGVSADLANALYDAGFASLEQLASAQAEELTNIQGIGEKKAKSLIEQARELNEQ